MVDKPRYTMPIKAMMKLHNMQDREQKRNQAILKDYRGAGYRLTAHKWLVTAGMDMDREHTEKGTVNDEKLDNNLARAKSKIFELAICNPWDYTVTLTLNKQKHDRYDLDQFRSDFNQFVRSERRRIGVQVKSLFIPQKHKDGAWHMHGFLYGLPDSELRDFTAREKTEYIRKALAEGKMVKTWSKYHDKFGFSVVEPIRCKEDFAKYIMRYITREMQNDVLGVGKHLYYRSRGLLEALEKERGTICGEMMPDYENEYVRVQWIDASANLEELRKQFFGQ